MIFTVTNLGHNLGFIASKFVTTHECVSASLSHCHKAPCIFVACTLHFTSTPSIVKIVMTCRCACICLAAPEGLP